MTRLLLWRHGRTSWNAEGRLQGQLESELDDTGRQQVVDSAPHLAARKPDLIIASDLRRTRDTAQPLADLTGLPVRLDPRLRERSFGPWQGFTDGELQERFPDDYQRWGLRTGAEHPEFETIDALAQRMVAALGEAADEVGDGTAVLVTHGGSARVGTGALLGWPRDLWRTLVGLGNCQVTSLVRASGRGWQLESYNGI